MKRWISKPNLKWTTEEEFQLYLGDDVLPENSNACLHYAESMIDFATMNKVSILVKKEALNEELLELVKQATYAQAHYLGTVGLEQDMMSGGSIQSFSLGKLNMSFTDGVSRSGQLSPQALRILWLTGLMYRGVKLK